MIDSVLSVVSNKIEKNGGLARLLDIAGSQDTKLGLSEERLTPHLDDLRSLISFFREYPDLFIDFIKGEDSKFEFYFYQRISK